MGEPKTKYDRKHERFPTNATAKLRMLGAVDWSDVKIKNLGKGGACIESPVPFAANSLLELMVNSPNGAKAHNFMARVAWTEGYRFGLQFITKL